MTTHQLTSRSQENNLISSSPILVIFYGSNKCGHCINIKPFFNNLCTKYPQVTFAAVETSNVPVENVESFPTFVFYKDKKFRGIILGADEKGLITNINNLL